MSGGSWGELASSCKATALLEAITVPSDSRVNSLGGVGACRRWKSCYHWRWRGWFYWGRPLPQAKKMHQNLGVWCPQLYSVFTQAPIPSYKIPFFPNQCSHFNSRHPMKLRVSASHRIRVYIWFLAISALRLQEIRSFTWCLSWEFKSLSSTLSFITLLGNIRSKHPILHPISFY